MSVKHDIQATRVWDFLTALEGGSVARARLFWGREGENSGK